VCRTTTAVDGAGWIAFSTFRKKPQVKAQLTYYLPEKGGSHDFKFGFESLNDSYRYGHNGKSGPIRYSYAGADASGSPDRIRFIDTGDPSTYGTDWTVGPNLDLHYSGYAQDRWAPNNRLTVTVDTRFKTPYTEAISGSFETQLPGESSARVTYVRKNHRDAGPFYVTNLIPAWVGKVTVPTVQTIDGERFSLLDVPDSLASQTDGIFANFPDGIYRYDTIEV